MSKYKLTDLLNEVHIDVESFEKLVNSFAEQGFTYYPLDRYDVDFSRMSIFLWLEEQAGDNAKAFTFNPAKKASGDVTGIGIFAMPGERYFYFDNATEEDIDLLAGAGQLNEVISEAWDDGIEWGLDLAVEEASNRLAEIGAEFIDHLDFDPGEMNQRHPDTYFTDISYFMKDKYGDETLHYALEDFYDGNSRHKAFVFSDGEYVDITMWNDDDIELFKGAGMLNEYDTNWSEDLDFNTETSAEDIANRLANIGAKYVEATIDIEPDEEYHETSRDYLDKMSELFSEKYGHEEELYFTYYVDEDTFIFSDGTYWYDEAGFLSDDVDLVIGAGQLDENQQVTEDLDLEDPKMGDTFDSYTYNLMRLIDPYGYNKGNFEELSHGYGYKYGDSHSAGDVYRENAINTLPKPIAEEITDIIESSWVEDRSKEAAKEDFLINNPEVAEEFYGLEDEITPELLDDAGYDVLSRDLKDDIEDHKASILNDEFDIRNGASIQTNFNRDPNSIYVYIYTHIYEYADGYMPVEVDLGQVYNDINSPEALKAAMKDFYDNKVPAFKKGEKPAEITRDEQIEESKKPLNENVEFEELIDNITTWPWHYAEIPDDLYQEMVDDLTAYGTPQDSEEVSDYLSNKLGGYLEKLDKQAGYVDSSGQYETDEGHFAIIDSNFYEALGLFYDSSQYEIYHSMGFYDMYELTPQEYQDVIEAGQIYNESLNEQKDVLEADDVEYNPSFEQIDEMLENATEELIYQVGRSFDGYGDPGVERLESGDGAIRFADGGFKSNDIQDIDNIYDNNRMPTKEANDAIENIHKEVYNYAAENAVEGLERSHPEVYAEFSGDPEMLTYQELEDAGEAYADVDPERSKMYYDAAEELDQNTYDAMRDDDDSLIFFEVEIQYTKADYPDGNNLDPELNFRGEVSTQYKILAAKEVTKTFNSEEELEEALEEGTKEIQDWFDGSEYEESKPSE